MFRLTKLAEVEERAYENVRIRLLTQLALKGYSNVSPHFASDNIENGKLRSKVIEGKIRDRIPLSVDAVSFIVKEVKDAFGFSSYRALERWHFLYVGLAGTLFTRFAGCHYLMLAFSKYALSPIDLANKKRKRSETLAYPWNMGVGVKRGTTVSGKVPEWSLAEPFFSEGKRLGFLKGQDKEQQADWNFPPYRVALLQYVVGKYNIDVRNVRKKELEAYLRDEFPKKRSIFIRGPIEDFLMEANLLYPYIDSLRDALRGKFQSEIPYLWQRHKLSKKYAKDERLYRAYVVWCRKVRMRPREGPFKLKA